MITLEAAREQENSYVPNAATMQLMSRVVIVPFVGATAVGKNYLMKASGYHVVGTTLTRGPRPDDDPQKNTYVTNEYLLSQIEAAAVVQYAVSPTAPTIYCSMPSDYTLDAANVMDCFFDAVEGLKSKGYAAVQTISVLTPASQWRKQLMTRYENDAPSYVRSRLDEADRSIDWSLDQHLNNRRDHLLLINDVDRLDTNLQTIHAFIDGRTHERVADDEAQAVAHDMHNLINEVRRGIGLTPEQADA